MNKNDVLYFFIIFSVVVVLVFLLSGCATTKTVYVPATCAKPTMPSPPHDYLRELNKNAGAPEFVKACLATRISGFQAYDNCRHILKGYV